MGSKAATPKEYMDSLPADRKDPMNKLRKVILENLPKGFEECINYGMLGYVVPHSIYPKGYHCDPKLPLGMISLGSQKNYISFHHMGLYADTKLLSWFQKEYTNRSKSKLDMGKGCVRFKKPDEIPYELIGELCSKLTPQSWVEHYENAFQKRK